ncbi:hypothetical protein [Noviherbaspirillum humi]|uniref:hypothetical protein n=1 Tax=Noviherbaspirillum humi TaxID=1688639 RepID=UPI0011607CC5|nr:hypothetical protein [Noviherbaspirillum humi]
MEAFLGTASGQVVNLDGIAASVDCAHGLFIMRPRLIGRRRMFSGDDIESLPVQDQVFRRERIVLDAAHHDAATRAVTGSMAFSRMSLVTSTDCPCPNGTAGRTLF